MSCLEIAGTDIGKLGHKPCLRVSQWVTVVLKSGILGVLAILQKAIISFVMSVCLSVCVFVSIEQIGSDWKDLHEI